MSQPLFRPDSDNRVDFVELLFDLVFVFAITQLSHLLLYHYDATGALQSGLLFLAIWWCWIYATWVLNRMNPLHLSVRLLLFGLMGLGLYLSMAIPDAFGERGLVFALALVAMNLLRTGFVLVSARGAPVVRQSYLRILIWFLLSGILWLAGGLAAPEARLAWWVGALAAEYLAPALSFYVPGLGRDSSRNWRVHGGHMAERTALFVIICLGETLLVSGATFAKTDWVAIGHAAFLASLGATLAMWWLYFHIGHHRGAHHISASDDPGRIARLSYTYAHLPIVAGIVISAVGCDLAIAHPGDPADLGAALSILGGPAVFLAGNLWFKALQTGRPPLSHLVGLVLCALAFLALPVLHLAALSLLAAAILAMTALWEHRSLGRTPAH